MRIKHLEWRAASTELEKESSLEFIKLALIHYIAIAWWLVHERIDVYCYGRRR